MKEKLQQGGKPSDERELVRFLARVPIFSALSEKELKSLVKETREVSYPAGKVIMKEGEPSMVFHLILEGAVEIKKKGKTIAKLGRGQFFGEMGLVADEPRSADVVAAEPTTCLSILAWTWRSYLRSNPSIAYEVIATLARRLRETESALVE
jgi:CRP/FNR family cyclic AMP-dependent transcriptional regulator